jgi:hypothetical protein
MGMNNFVEAVTGETVEASGGARRLRFHALTFQGFKALC